MELNLIEKFLLIAHRQEKGRFYIDGFQLTYGLIGAVLLKMSLENRIEIDNQFLKITNDVGIQDEVMQEVVNIIKTSEKQRKIKSWVSRLEKKSRKYKWVYLNNLEQKRIIRIENKKFLGLFPYKLTYQLDTLIREELISELRSNVLNDKKIPVENISLLALVQACQMHKILSKDKKELKLIKKELKRIIKENPIAETVDKTIREIQAAIIASIAASVTVTAAVSS